MIGGFPKCLPHKDLGAGPRPKPLLRKELQLV